MALAGVLETDPDERVLDLRSAATERGSWAVGPEGLALSQPAPVGGLNYWVAEHPTFSSGVIRARISVGERLDCSVLFRASVGARHDELLHAYGLSLEPDAVGFHRWTDGEVVSLDRQKVPGLGQKGALEVVIFAVGPHFTATVYDAADLTPIATVAAHDRTLSRGSVGLRAFSQQDASTRLTHLAILAEHGGGHQPAPAPAPRDDAFGPRRLWELPAGSPGPQGSAPARTSGGTSWYVLTVEQAELARRAGLKPLHETGHLPKWVEGGMFRSFELAPPTRSAAGVDLDPSRYRDSAAVRAALEAFHQHYPKWTRLETLGTSHQGRPILALRVGDDPDRPSDEPAVLLTAAQHGSELLSIDYALDALERTLERATEPQVARWLAELDLWFVPDLNPDATDGFLYLTSEMGRKNGRDNDGDGHFEPWEGVDLNRNYPLAWGRLGEDASHARSFPSSLYYRGEGPGSEPEAKALMALAERERFVAALGWHTSSTLVLCPYTIDGLANPTPDVAWQVAEELVAPLPRQPNGRRYKVQRKIYSVDGAEQDWMYGTYGTLAYIVEGSHHNPSDPSVRAASILGARGLYEGLLDRLVEGPRISGHTRDPQGRPVSSVITVEPLKTANGERWSSRPRDGRFDRLLPEPGRYVVRASAPGFAEVAVPVDAGEAPVVVDLVLTPTG